MHRLSLPAARLVAGLFLLAAGCGPARQAPPAPAAAPGPPPAATDVPTEAPAPPWETAGPLTALLQDDGTTAPAFRGAWRSRGYGWVLEIGEEGQVRYEEGDVCYPTPDATRALSAMASVHYRYGRMLPGGEAAIFQLMDGDTNVVFDRLDALPEACRAPVDASPAAVGAAFLDHLDRHYAFFDRRLPDREARELTLRRALAAEDLPEAALWDALATFLDGISDSHTKLIGAVDGEKRRQQDGQGQTLPAVRGGMGETPWLVGLIEQTRGQLDGGGVHTLQDRVLWGVIDGRVGYLQVFVMGGFTDRQDFASPAWAAAELAALDAVLDDAFAAFADLDAVVVDLSNNRGGWDRVARTLPGRFVHAPRVAYTTQTHGADLPPFPHRVQPADGPRFDGPVYLLTSDVTVSGGELSTLAFRQLPQVTHVGDTTRGAFSTPLAKALPNGWLLELSDEVFAAPDGTVYEETGIPPQVPLEVFPAEDPVGGHARALDAVVAMAVGEER